MTAKQCENCGKPLALKAARDAERKRFCSRECLGQAAGRHRGGWQAAAQQAHCLRCGTAFQPKFPRHMYCTKQCQRAAASMRHDIRSATLDGYLIKMAGKCGRKLGGSCLRELWEKQQGRCAITGVQMTHTRGAGRVMTNASLDRIDSRSGYEPGNLQLVCFIVNVMKQELALDEFIQWCRKVVTHASAQQISE